MKCWLVLALGVASCTHAQASDLPPVPDQPVSSRYRAIEGATSKTEAELKVMGLTQTGQHMVRYRCKSSCLSVSYVHGVFYGKDEAGSRMLYVCPNPERDVDLTRFPPPPAPPRDSDGWKCYLFDEMIDRGEASHG